MVRKSNFRTPAEDEARSACRLIARTQGAKLFKILKTHVQISPCSRWPEGLVTMFNGWVDLQARLEYCLDNPEYVTDGVYIYDADASFEIGPAEEIKKHLQTEQESFPC